MDDKNKKKQDDKKRQDDDLANMLMWNTIMDSSSNSHDSGSYDCSGDSGSCGD